MKEVMKIISQLQNTSGTNDKIAIIKNNKDNELLKKVLYYTYSDNLQYGFSEKKLNELLDQRKQSILRGNVTKWDNVFSMLDELSESNINDSLRENVINFLLMQNDSVRELYIHMILKDLRCTMGSKLINKAIPKLIKEWDVQQAYSREKQKLKDDEWIALSLKLNGIRSTRYKNGFKSRQNKEMIGLNHIMKDLDILDANRNMVFDGEMIRKNIDNVSDEENFALTTSILNSDAAEKPEIEFVIFDILPKEEFDNGESKLTFKERLKTLQLLEDKIKEYKLHNLRVAPLYYQGTDHSKIDEILDKVDSEGMEGLMLLRDMKYKCKRHNGILKCKKFHNADLKIVGYEEGTGKLVNSLGSFIVEYKDNTVGVGSGYTDKERKEFWDKKDEYIGKIMQVKYKTETKDKKTKLLSIQFPTFECMRFDKDEPSYN